MLDQAYNGLQVCANVPFSSADFSDLAMFYRQFVEKDYLVRLFAMRENLIGSFVVPYVPVLYKLSQQQTPNVLIYPFTSYVTYIIWGKFIYVLYNLYAASIDSFNCQN